MGASIRAGITLGRSAAVLGLGMIGQASLRCLLAAGANPVIGIDSVKMRREAALAAGADLALDPSSPNLKQQLNDFLGTRGAEIIADATGVPDAVPVAMSLACDGGQVVVVGSPRGKAKDVNFYDDLHRRYIEVTGAHGNMLFEPAHTRLAGAWDINKAQRWLLGAFAADRVSLVGGLIGTLLVTRLPARYFAIAVPWLILSATLLFALQPTLIKLSLRFRPAGPPDPNCRSTGGYAGLMVAQFLIAVYGGYFGA